MRLILIGYTAPARELYTGSLFRARRRYAASVPWPWRIVSAKYGLICPEREIEPYDLHISDLEPWELTAWRERVSRQWGYAWPDEYPEDEPGVVELHLSRPYVEALPWDPAGDQWSWPMEGLQIGQQMAWYADPPHRPGYDSDQMELW